MKKIFALLLCLALVLSFAACSPASNDDIRGSITQKPSDDLGSSVTESTPVEDTPEFSIGVNTGNKWENSYIGLGCKLSDEFTFYNDEQIEELNRNTMANLGESLGEDYLESIKDLDFFYDMYVTTEDASSTINVMIENHTALELVGFDAKKTLEQNLPSLKTSYEGMGYENVQVSLTSVTLAGKAFPAAKLTAEFNGLTATAYSAMGRVGNHLYSIAIFSFDPIKLEELVNSFYAVK